MRWCAILVAALIVQGCGLLDQGLVCTDQFVYAITVEVRDSSTGEVLASPLTGVLTDGEYRETMEVHANLILQGGGERPGVYDVEIRAEGYRPWQIKGVEAGQDECHVENIMLLAGMVRSDAP